MKTRELGSNAAHPYHLSDDNNKIYHMELCLN